MPVREVSANKGSVNCKPMPFVWSPLDLVERELLPGLLKDKPVRKDCKSWEFIVGLRVSSYLFWSCSEVPPGYNLISRR